MKTILVTGATGLLGPYMCDAAKTLGRVVSTARSGGDYSCELTNNKSVGLLFREVKPDVVIHTAALTNVDKCETCESLAYELNRDIPETLSREALNCDAKMVLISTDQVYSGVSPDNHESDQPKPVNVYGASKLAGEIVVMQQPSNLSLRTNMFGPSRTSGRLSLSDFFVDKLRRNEHMIVFKDMYFSPLHFETLSELIVQAIRKDLKGVYNLGSRGGMTKKDFCFLIADALGIVPQNVTVGNGLNITTRAKRPADLRMNVTKIEKKLGQKMPSLKDQVYKLVS